MSSLRSSRGYSSVTLDRLRYGSGSGPGVLAVGIDGVVGPTGTANLQSLNVMGTATIDTAVIDTLIIDDVEFRTVSAIDFQTQTLEVSGTGTINQLTVGGLTGGTGMFGYLSVNGFTGGTGSFHDLTVDRLHINEYINDVNHVSTISADYIAGAKIRAGDENAAAVRDQYEALYVKGDAYVEGGFTGGSLSTNGLIRGGSLNVTGGATAGSFSTTGLIQGGSLNVTGGATAGSFSTTGLIQGGSLNVTGGATAGSLSTTELIVTGGATAGSFSTTGPIQGASLNVTGGVTANSLSSSTVYVDNIYPFPAGSTGFLGISSGILVTNVNTIDAAKATTISMGQTDTAGGSSVTAYLVGDDSSGFGGDDNNKEQFCWYSYPKGTTNVYKVESTPLKAGTTGPAGVAGAIGDKYLYGSVQVGTNLAINGNLTVNTPGVITGIGATPTGSITMFAGASAPSGWLLCDGAAVSRLTYASLFAIIGTTYGAGSSSTTFNLPNMQQRFPIGNDNASYPLGSAGSSHSTTISGSVNDTTLTTDQIPSHTHTVNDPGHRHSTVGFWNVGSADGPSKRAVANGDAIDYGPGDKLTTMYDALTGITLGATGGSQPHNHTFSANVTVTPPYLSVNYIIKV